VYKYGEVWCSNSGETFTHLARSANLPEGTLLALISSFFIYLFLYYMSKAISVSTGPIFTIFSPDGRYLREFS